MLVISLRPIHTRDFAPEHALGARSGSKAPPCIPTISWVYFILGSRISNPQNAPRYLTSWIFGSQLPGKIERTWKRPLVCTDIFCCAWINTANVKHQLIKLANIFIHNSFGTLDSCSKFKVASTESVEIDELEFCVWHSHVFTKSVWIFHGQFSKNSIKSPFLLSSQKPQASPRFPGNLFTNWWVICKHHHHQKDQLFLFWPGPQGSRHVYFRTSSQSLVWWISATPHQVSFVCSHVCTITRS